MFFSKHYTPLFIPIINILCILYPIHGRQDCISNSHHLTQEYDNKEYHPVPDCPCPCSKLNPKRNHCDRCGHDHFPKNIQFVASHDNAKTPSAKPISIPKDLKGLLLSLISQHMAHD